MDTPTPPRGLQRLKIARGSVHWYSRSNTLSLCWRAKWRWFPERSPAGCWDGWCVHWGWFLLERLGFEPGDDWGGRAAEIQDRILDELAEAISKAPQHSTGDTNGHLDR